MKSIAIQGNIHKLERKSSSLHHEDTTNSSNNNKLKKTKTSAGTDDTNAVAKALRRLLDEDPLLKELHLTSLTFNNDKNHPHEIHQIHKEENDDIVKDSKEGASSHDVTSDDLDPAVAYAVALIDTDYYLSQRKNQANDASSSSSLSSLEMGGGNISQKAKDALVEVERKLALVTSLCERISREKPEHVAAPLLKLHGFSPYHYDWNSEHTDRHDQHEILNHNNSDKNDSSSATAVATAASGTGISMTLERCDRLVRQSQLLDTVANRVETALERGLERMSDATVKLERVLKISQVLKMIMKLKFEAKKVMKSGLDFEALEKSIRDVGSYGDKNQNHEYDASQYIDLRDLTRAAASVAVMEELLNHEDLKEGSGIDIVEEMRPEVERISRAVRKAAAALLEEQHSRGTASMSMGAGTLRLPSATRLGATLQVYYHLGELPSATWNAVCLGLDKAEKASGNFLNPSAIKRIMESARAEAKVVADTEMAAAAASTSGTSAATVAVTASAVGGGDKKQKEILYERAFKVKMREKKAEAASKWATSIAEASLQVFNLHRVLLRKTDPVTRQNFMDVVHATPVPEQFQDAKELFATSSRQGSDGKYKSQTPLNKISIFSLFWNQMCINLGTRLQRLLKYENGSMASEIATFYPAIRAAALEMLTSVQDIMQTGALSSSSAFYDELSGFGPGITGKSIMGGSAALDDALLFGVETDLDGKTGFNTDAITADAVGLGSTGADQWTRKNASSAKSNVTNNVGLPGKMPIQSHTSAALSSILSSPEWLALQGTGDVGLYPLQRVFIANLSDRLQVPLKKLFVENRVVDENGIDMKMLPSLPSEKDLEHVEKVLHNELCLADPREGGGDFTMTTMISESIVDMVEVFCSLARGATSGTPEDQLLHPRKGTPTEELLHDMKVADILATLSNQLRNLPESTFIVPYRPTYSRQHEEAANMCQIALLPAMHEIESTIKHQLLSPLCNVLNRDIGSVIGTMHHGIYIESDHPSDTCFVQDRLAPKYESIVNNILHHLPYAYRGMITSTICKYSIYCFISNASLIRPLGENGRLRIIQDLTDLELTLEQLVTKVGGGSSHLQQIDGGRPYAELRAVRQMLVWNGLEDKTLSSEKISKLLLAEIWIKDLRPSTLFHFLLTFAPPLLSSPHHANRISAADYVDSLVRLDGSTDDGEGKAWPTMMACCEAYFQRETVDSGGDSTTHKGDKRIPTILMNTGPELLRHRRY